MIIKKTVEINGLKVAGDGGGEFFSLPFQKDEDFCDFFHFNFPKTSKFISRRINAWRVVCRLSVLELSKRAGLSRPTVTALLHGSAKISIENVQKVLVALDAAAQPKKLSIEEVIKEKDPQK